MKVDGKSMKIFNECLRDPIVNIGLLFFIIGAILDGFTYVGEGLRIIGHFAVLPYSFTAVTLITIGFLNLILSASIYEILRRVKEGKAKLSYKGVAVLIYVTLIAEGVLLILSGNLLGGVALLAAGLIMGIVGINKSSQLLQDLGDTEIRLFYLLTFSILFVGGTSSQVPHTGINLGIAGFNVGILSLGVLIIILADFIHHTNGSREEITIAEVLNILAPFMIPLSLISHGASHISLVNDLLWSPTYLAPYVFLPLSSGISLIVGGVLITIGLAVKLPTGASVWKEINLYSKLNTFFENA